MGTETGITARLRRIPLALRARGRTLRTRVTTHPRVRRVRERRAWRVLWPGTEPLPHRIAPGHFYSPVPSIADVDAWAAADPTASLPGIDLRVDAQVELLRSLDVTLPTGPRFATNSYYDNGDVAIYQALLRARESARVVEVGGGWSTAALFDAGGTPTVTVIDPDPSRVYALLLPDDLARCTVRAERLQDVDLDPFLALDAGDILFVDSTHVGKLGSDVLRLLFEILPRLRAGVAVHFHDVHFPFEYPQEWFRESRYWNEAYLLRAFLEHNDAFSVLLWADLLRRFGRVDDPALAAALAGGMSAAIWIEKR